MKRIRPPIRLTSPLCALSMGIGGRSGSRKCFLFQLYQGRFRSSPSPANPCAAHNYLPRGQLAITSPFTWA